MREKILTHQLRPRVSKELLSLVRDYAKHERVNESEAIRRLVFEGLQKWKSKKRSTKRG